MKKEIDAIRAKDISQGGLTQGQQTQIARNEQRMAQVNFDTSWSKPSPFVLPDNMIVELGSTSF